MISVVQLAGGNGCEWGKCHLCGDNSMALGALRVSSSCTACVR